MAAVLLACSPAAALAAEGQPVPASLVKKVTEAYGGATLSRVRAVRQVGSVTALAQGGKVGRLERVFALPDSLRVEIAYPGEPHEIRVHHAGRGVRDGADVTGTMPHAAMILQAARIALPLRIAARDPRIRYAGRIERESRTLETVVLGLDGGLALTGEIDPASGRIVRTIGRIPGPGGQPLEFVNTYSDFRKSAGITFARREENFARGVHTGDTLLEHVEVMREAPAGVFEPAPPAPAHPGEQL